MTPDLIARLERAEGPKSDERGYLVDPQNPWPRGSDWWLMHNERYTRSQWWRRHTALRARMEG